jgi:HEAT repeat protein
MRRTVQDRRRLTPETNSLITQLRANRSQLRTNRLWIWIGIDRLPVEEVLLRIAERGEPAAVPWLLDELFAPKRRTRDAAADAVARLLENVSGQDVAWFDDHVRRWCGSSWRGMSALHVSLTHRNHNLLTVACCHPSGYVRETALRALPAERLGGTTLLFLILRLNDWVPNVREAARERFDEALEALPGDELISGLGMIPWMQSGQLRGDLTQVADLLRAVFEGPKASGARDTARRSDDPIVRREAFLASIRSGSLSPAELARGLADPDPLIATAILRRAMDTGRADLCLRALESPHGRVRAAAMREIRVFFPADAEALALDFMFDPSPAVREAARTVAGNVSPGRILEAGRRVVGSSSGRTRAAALTGLTEAGVPESELRALLESCANDGSARVRASVLKCIAQIDGGLSESRALTALSDPSRRVAAAAAYLATGDRSISAERLWGAVKSGRWSHTRRHAFLLLSKQGKWISLLYTLRALSLPDIELRGLAESALERWVARVNRSGVAPTEAERIAVAKAIEGARSRLGTETCQLLEFGTS